MTKKNKKFIIQPLTVVFFALALKSSPSLFLCAVICSSLHELGHYLTARVMGLTLTRLTVYPFGADMVLSPELRGYRTDVVVHLSGPTVNLMLYCIGSMSGMSELFCTYNLALGIMNLLPVSGLDGGNALYAALCTFTLPDVSYRILNSLTLVFTVSAWVVSVYIMLILGGDPSLFFIASFAFFTYALRRRAS